MARRRVLYFFSFSSPFAALADFRIDPMLESVGAELEPIPLIPPAMDPPTGLALTLQESKRDYLREDAARWARKLHIPWVEEPAAIDGRDAVAAYYFAGERGQERNFRNALFRSRWCEGKDIDDGAVLAECAEDCRISGNDLRQAVRSRLYHDRADQNIARALEHGVFGVPIFIFDGKRFWGNDRIEHLIDELRAADPS